jgi:hypothetical protein
MEVRAMKDGDHLYAFGRQVPRRSRHGAALSSVKIGRSIDVSSRLGVLQSKFPGDDLWEIDRIEGLGCKETAVHHALAPWSVGGEWFDNVILVVILRWGFREIVDWALDVNRERNRKLSVFMDYAQHDIRENLLEKLCSSLELP